jgi:2-iminobutanoate/2-iminopropanoate deaminase
MQLINAPDASTPAGAYSQAVVHDGIVYVSGQVPRDRSTEGECPCALDQQVQLVLTNLAVILQAAGSDIGHVLKVTIYVTDVAFWETINNIYVTFFGEHRPARTVIPVPRLRYNYKLELDAIAAVRGSDAPAVS